MLPNILNVSVLKTIQAALASGRWDLETLKVAAAKEQGHLRLKDVRTPVPQPETPIEKLEARVSELGSSIVDYRDLSEWPRDQKYDKSYGYPLKKTRALPVGRRPIEQVTTLCLHIPGVELHHKRWLGVPVHGAVSSGKLADMGVPMVVLCHYIEQYMSHGHAYNKFSEGFEVGGFEEIHIELARAYVLYFKDRREAALGEGCKCYIGTHRFAHKSRPVDCGQRIWDAVGQWAIEEHGFLLGPVVSSGRPLPFKEGT